MAAVGDQLGRELAPVDAVETEAERIGTADRDKSLGRERVEAETLAQPRGGLHHGPRVGAERQIHQGGATPGSANQLRIGPADADRSVAAAAQLVECLGHRTGRGRGRFVPAASRQEAEGDRQGDDAHRLHSNPCPPAGETRHRHLRIIAPCNILVPHTLLSKRFDW